MDTPYGGATPLTANQHQRRLNWLGRTVLALGALSKAIRQNPAEETSHVVKTVGVGLTTTCSMKHTRPVYPP